MENYINIFEANLNFTRSKSNSIPSQENIFLYKLENFDIFDTLEYEKMCIGFSQILSEHIKKNIFDNTLLSDTIHLEYAVSRTYILEKNNLEFLHQGSVYSFEDFCEHIEITYDLSFVDYSIFLLSYLLQQYSKQNISDIKSYILNQELLV